MADADGEGRVVGDEAVGAAVDELGHLIGAVHGPRVHVEAPGMSGLDEPRGGALPGEGEELEGKT